ncbi:MarC family NAAT transporter [Congregibacter brevis]|uniref:UPF0056 membrane protein n=1 Tax=Congregibacter brevis TaxID=3081201 RepID=A0ABZ0IHQ2_9GAMM|nr:MarC family NAAT transporter [Congregibacter sp. IMCC45268]
MICDILGAPYFGERTNATGLLLMIAELASYILLVIMGLVPIVNPFSTAPLFISMTAGGTKAQRNKTAMLACIYMAAMLIVFLLLGTFILNFFGISIASLRMAGGMVIAFMGFKMLFPEESTRDSDVTKAPDDPTSFAFTPLAMPMLSGPGALSVVIAMGAQLDSVQAAGERLLGYAIVAIGILISCFICWLVLHSATAVVRILGRNGITALTKLMGFILICIGVEFVMAVLKLNV